MAYSKYLEAEINYDSTSFPIAMEAVWYIKCVVEHFEKALNQSAIGAGSLFDSCLV